LQRTRGIVPAAGAAVALAERSGVAFAPTRATLADPAGLGETGDRMGAAADVEDLARTVPPHAAFAAARAAA
jgi:hypothetical protein